MLPAAIANINPTSNIRINPASHPRGYDPAKKPMRERLDNLIMAEHAFDTTEIPYSLKLFSSADETPHIHFNLGQIHMFQCAPTLAREHFERAVMMDSWFCAAWLMLGSVRFNEGEYEDAMQAWNTALKCFRGRKTIDYEQLGLAYTVHYEEVLWNKAAAERALEMGGSAGVKPACVPMGAIFRVPGRIAKVRGKVVGQGTEWGFRGQGRVVGRCESIYLERHR
jgi:tetratricopeptide (TPR) repeat protein